MQINGQLMKSEYALIEIIVILKLFSDHIVYRKVFFNYKYFHVFRLLC